MSIIKINSLTKIYPVGNEKVTALDNVSLEMEKGKIYCLLGTSGSGKSTLLNMMAGLEKPTRGQIIIKGSHLEKMNENQLAKFRQKNIGFVFQSYNLLPAFTALENVTLPLIFKKVPKRIREKKAREMLISVGLKDRIKHTPAQMSGGQQQRVSIARAFVNNPDIIFADEPTGNLDTKTTLEMMDLITKISMENNQTLVIVTHDLEISEYADVIIHIRDGKVDRVEEGKKKIEYKG